MQWGVTSFHDPMFESPHHAVTLRNNLFTIVYEVGSLQTSCLETWHKMHNVFEIC